MKRLGVVAAAALAFGCSDPTSPTAVLPEASGALVNGPRGRQFIVTLTSGVDAKGLAKQHGITPQYSYDKVMNGFAGEISDLARAGLLRDVRVRAIEEVVPVSIASEPAASWGLDRIDQRLPALDGLYSYTRTGAGVAAYVVDTGIRTTHDEFEGRASHGYDAFGQGGDDCHGHGTHVAGTVGGRTYGVARGVGLVGVRVIACDGTGTTAGVVAGLDWILTSAVAPRPSTSCARWPSR
jgi:subtilisin family serine protease